MQPQSTRTSIWSELSPWSWTASRLIALLFAMLFSVLITSESALAETNRSRVILSLDDSLSFQKPELTLSTLSNQTGLTIKLIRSMSGNALVASVTAPGISQNALHQKLLNAPGIKAVASDAIVRTTATVDDPRFDEQWQLQSPDQYLSSLDVVRAWDITHGSADVVVAIVDTGVDFNHPDLEGRLLPGYDFVSPLSQSVDEGVRVPPELEFIRSHDGDGRDGDATDPGDAINETLRQQFESIDIECGVTNSSWHGTAMASIIGSNANDGIGIAGIDRHAKILPVRAIGKCGGRRSDMLDAIRWAAGVPDPALPPNPTPARIINLSLGVDDLCTTADQNAINEAIKAGALIVAAVGNNGRNTDAEPSSPSHCQNVIGVMAVDKYGFRSSYSNFGRDADVAAPGGDLAPSPNRILVATNKGVSEPSTEFGYRAATGTSVAAPHVAGVLALMLSLKPELTNRELEALVLDSSRPFPDENDKMFDEDFKCEQAYCGAGILDAYAAVQAVDSHVPGMRLDSPSLAAAQSVPVSVGSYASFGCTVASRDNDDPIALVLCLCALMMLARRRTNQPVAHD